MNQSEINKTANDYIKYSQVQDLKRQFMNKWWSTSKEFPKLDNKSSFWHKKRKEKEANRFINQFIRFIKEYPKENHDRKIWKSNVQSLIDDFIINSNLISMKDKDLLLNLELLGISESFVAEARSFDSGIMIEDIGQAMRNVWIMNITQMLLSRGITLTPSVFSYSMLYPYTDNYLDDEQISREDKLRISNRFSERLKGHSIEAENEYERRIFQLVKNIEEEYDRADYPMVYESLLSIHKAQIISLKQQGERTGPYEEDILGISIEKGGVSVLADAYLVNGTLTDDEAYFFFGYGVLLQICDDLQDGKTDFNNGHMTIVSQLLKKWPLDRITNRLLNFTFDILDNEFCFNCENSEEIRELIRKNCVQLVLFSMAKNKKLYSKKYFREIKQYLPYTPRYIANIYKKLTREMMKLEDSYNGIKTEKIIMNALKQGELQTADA